MLPDPAGPDADRRQQKGDVMARLVLRLKQVLAPTGLPRSTIFVLQQQGIFPQSIKLGSKATGWYEDEGARVPNLARVARLGLPVPRMSGAGL